MNNENRFKQAMAALAAVYQNTLQAEQVAMYWKVLGKFNSDHLDKAVELHIADASEGKWFPKPAHLIEHIQAMVSREKSKVQRIAQQNQIPHKAMSEEEKARMREMFKGLKT